MNEIYTESCELFEIEYNRIEDGEEDDISTKFQRNQKNQLIDLKKF